MALITARNVTSIYSLDFQGDYACMRNLARIQTAIPGGRGRSSNRKAVRDFEERNILQTSYNLEINFHLSFIPMFQ